MYSMTYKLAELSTENFYLAELSTEWRLTYVNFLWMTFNLA